MNNPFEVFDMRLSNIENLLLNLKHNPAQPPQPDPDQLLTIQQAGELLCLTVPTMYSLVSRAEVPCMKKHKRLYFSKVDLLNWVKTGRKKTLAEAASDADAFLSTQKRKGGNTL